MQLGRWSLRPLRGGPDGIAVRFAQDGADVTIGVLAAGAVSDEDVEWAIDRAAGIAGLHDDSSPFDDVANNHALVARLHRRFRGARLTRTPTVWESFLRTVIEQLVTSQEAIAARRRVWRRWGDRVGATDLHVSPRAEVIAKVGAWEMRPLGVSLKRATTILEGARRARRLEELRDDPPEEAMRKMMTLRGVGPWTANVVAMQALGYADAVLVGDSGAPFVTTMALTGKAGGDEAMLACLEPFRPHRARVHRLLEIAHRADGGVEGVPARAPTILSPHRRTPWRY